jgi:hypothetical protein
MAVDVGAVVEGLFMGFMAPLVLGGEMRPERPIGGKTALEIGNGRPLTDVDRVSHVQLARVRIARKLVPIDRLEAPTAEEWALAAVLHDVVQSTHPGFDAAFRRSAPNKLLELAEKTLELVPGPRSAHDALSRHTWFSRMFEITRTDTIVSWWVGSAKFLGEDPPSRLTKWPELRRVNQVKMPRPLMELPSSGAAVDAARFTQTLAAFLAKTPLTDFGTCTREAPSFAWTEATLGLTASRAGRTLALRALALLPPQQADAVLGRATRQLLGARAWAAASIAMDLLGERALARAEASLSRSGEGNDLGLGEGDAAFARAAGAVAARQWLAQHGGAMREPERREVLQALEPLASSKAARELQSMMAAAAAPAQ